MSKDELKEKVNEFEEQIKQLRKQVLDVKQSYILEHAEFEIDEKVVINKGMKNERFGFVRAYKLGWDFRISYDINKTKKDGTRSMHLDFIWNNDTISKID